MINLNPMEQPCDRIEMTEFEYEQLVAPADVDSNLLAQIDNNISGANWMNSHQCITMLRSICKFYPQFAPEISVKYAATLLELLSNGKPQLLKNLFRLLKEIFSMSQVINLEAQTAMFLPAIIRKSSIALGHIKELSQEVLTVISANCVYASTFKITAELTCDKNIQVVEISLKLLAVLVQSVGVNIVQMDPVSLNTLMQALSLLVGGKRETFKTAALDICMLIFNFLGAQNYVQLMNFALTPQNVEAMGKAMNTHRASKKKMPNLSEVLRQRKTEMGFQQQPLMNVTNWGTY